MRKYIEVGNRTFSVGDKFTANAEAESSNICAKGHVITLRIISDDPEVGISSDIEMPNWGDLDGTISDGHGLWITIDSFINCFTVPSNRKVVVSGDMQYKKQNLRGMKGKLLKNVNGCGEDHCFVEMESNIGAGSADGLGKKGHCVLVPMPLLTFTK